MTEIVEKERLIEQVIGKHRHFIDTFNAEFSGLDDRLNSSRQQLDTLKKEIEANESRIGVLTEKYHLLFYQAKKMREELFNTLIEKMRAGKSANVLDVTRPGSRIEEFEKKLQNSKNIEEEEKIIGELKKLFYEIESAAGKAGITITFKGIIEKLNDANSSHKELLSLQNKPREHTIAAKEHEKQIGELEGRHNWLKHRIDSHNSALAYWEKQKGGVNVG